MLSEKERLYNEKILRLTGLAELYRHVLEKIRKMTESAEVVKLIDKALAQEIETEETR